MNTTPPAVPIAPPRLNEPSFAASAAGTFGGNNLPNVPSDTSHFLVPSLRSMATSEPNGGGEHGAPPGANMNWRRITYGVPLMSVYWALGPRVSAASVTVLRSNFARGMSRTSIGIRFTGTTAIWRTGSNVTPPQCAPPMLDGYTREPRSLGGVYGPSFRSPAMRARQASRCSGVIPQ